MVHRYLKADYRIIINAPGHGLASRYAQYYPFAIVFVVVFAAVVPFAYALILYSIRNRLQVRIQLCSTTLI